MFKKIEIWIFYLFILLGIPLMIGFGFLVRYELYGGKKFGQLPKTALFLSEIPINVKKAITSLKRGEAEVDNRFPLLDGFNGTPNSQESYLLLSRYNGKLRQGVVELIDLTEFKTLHTWNPDLNSFNKMIDKVDEFKSIDTDHNDFRQLLYHPELTDDGGLLFNSSALRKIDSCSNLVFQNTHDFFHHSIETDIEGNIWVPSHMYPTSLPANKVGTALRREGGFYDDAIVKLSPEGEVLFEKSVSQIFIDNGLEYLLFALGKTFSYDPIHLNDIQPVDFDGEFWKKGDVFLSVRNQSMVILYRPETNQIIWKGTGPFFYHHDVDILNNHLISVFNNNTKILVDGLLVDGNSEVIIYDFKTNKYSYYLNESLIKNDVRTPTNGRSQILPNGDLLVEETKFGRTLYFNSDGTVRWTHVNRENNGKTYAVGWSRILYLDKDIQIVNKFLKSKKQCNN